MATAEHRGDLATAAPLAPLAPMPPGPPPRLSWLGFVGFALIVLLLAVALVQARQFALLRQVVQTGDDYGVLTIFQAETEYLRLREQWRAAADERQPIDADALKLRYEIWVSRVELLHADKPSRVIRGDAEYVLTIQQADAFIANADRVFGNANRPSEALLTPSFVQSMQPALEALGKPMHGMSLTAAHNVAEQMEKRATAVREQNQLGLFLTVFLSVLTLAFAAIALRQMRQLRERRVALEELATNLRQARREAESASEAKSAFLANMSHEIRTPFHGLMGMLSLLRETGLTPRQIDYLRTATESADHLLAILNDILDMSQLESGRMTLAPAAVDLRTLLRDVEALMRPQANGKQLALHIDADPGVPGRVMLDATRVKQVVFNLLSNAIKFSDQGAVVLDVRSRPLSDPRADTPGRSDNTARHEVEFIVTDTGIGMDDAMLAQLFNRFAQGDNSSRRRHGGTGLGLEISRNLARLMGGDITARSKPGAGSSFIFRLPVQALREAGVQQRMATADGASGARHGPASRALRVLVAEDHPVNRQYLAALLENLGHHAHFTANGQEAVQALQAEQAQGGARFDVVLMDLHMPVLDGVGATRAIRALADAALNTVPIVALTADAFAETRERCLVAGMNDFLTKPVSPQKLATSLRRLFGSEAGGGPAAGDISVAASHAIAAALPARMAGDAPRAAHQEPHHAPHQGPHQGPRQTMHAGHAALVDEAAIASSLQSMSAARLGDMLHNFLDQGSMTVQRLRSAVREAQPLELRVNAHAAKGAALNLGLSALAHTAEALQQGASHLPAHEIARLVQRYEQQLQQTRSAVQAMGLIGTGEAMPPASHGAVDAGAVGGGLTPPQVPLKR